MANRIKLKRSSVTGNVPDSGDLEVGEIALNMADKKLFFKDGSSNVQEISGASDTAADILTKIKTVDGSGSGLDADLLDGQQGSYYYSPANAPDPVITLTGDVTGSGTMTNLGNVSITATVGNDSHTHSYLPLSGGTVTGPIYMPDSISIYKPFNMIENASPQWILLCQNAGNNDVNGRIEIDRTSGNYQAVRLDVIVSSGTSAMYGGTLSTLQVLQSSEDYRLVSVTYGGVNYIAIKYTGNTYPMTTQAKFTGRIVNTAGNTLLVVSSGITNETSFGGNSEAYYEVDNFNVSGNITAAGNTVYHSGNVPTWNQDTTGNAATATNADTVDGKHASTTRNSANTIPVRDGNGFLNLGWINTTSGNTTSTITDFYVNTNDGYIRKATKSHVLSQLGISTVVEW